MTNYTAAAKVAAATKADASIAGLWADAYAAAAHDMDNGGDLRGLAEAITKTGVKCSKDTAQDYVLAASLTAHGTAFDESFTAHLGEGKVMRVHSLIAKARKARGVAYVRAILAKLEGIDDAEKLAKALSKAIRELDAAKREPKKDGGDQNDKGDKGDQGDQGEGVETTVPTIDAMLASVIGPTAKILDMMNAGQFPTDEGAFIRWLNACGAIGRLLKDAQDHKAAKAAKADVA